MDALQSTDGMDQNKTNIPCLAKIPKQTQCLWRLRTHLTGVLVHTRTEKGKKPYAFYDLLQYPHDANLTLSILVHTLNQLGPCLPPVLFLQMDNCYRENKNRFVFAFCSYLIMKRIFHEVSLIPNLAFLHRCISMSLSMMIDTNQLFASWPHP